MVSSTTATAASNTPTVASTTISASPPCTAPGGLTCIPGTSIIQPWSPFINYNPPGVLTVPSSTTSPLCHASAGFTCVPGTSIIQPPPWGPGNVILGVGSGPVAASVPASPAPAPAPYVAKAVEFADGSNYLAGNNVSNPAATSLLSFSLWIKESTAGYDRGTYYLDGGQAYSWILTSDWNVPTDIYADFSDSHGNAYVVGNTGVWVPNVWTHILGSIDISHPAESRIFNFYVNDVAGTSTFQDKGSAFNISPSNDVLIFPNFTIL
jgi:hypothetical protein